MTEEIDTNLENLQQEADLAADYIESILDAADFAGDIQMSIVSGRVLLEVSDDQTNDLDKFVGDDGRVMVALQHLTRLAVQNKTETVSKLILDIQGFRQKKQENMQPLFDEALQTLEENPYFAFEPMNSFERKILHDLARQKNLYSGSIGLKKCRRTLIAKTEADLEQGLNDLHDE